MRHHLAIVHRQFLDAIVAGHKSVECRLGKMGYPPHQVLNPGDLIWFKAVSGPVRAVATARSVQFYANLTPAGIDRIRREWNHEIQAPEAFWQARRDASAATLVRLSDVCPLQPFWIVKRDFRAWVVLAGPPVPGRPVATARLTRVPGPGPTGL